MLLVANSNGKDEGNVQIRKENIKNRNSDLKNKNLTRREFIKKSFGAAGALGVLSIPVPEFLKARKNTAAGPGLTSKSPANLSLPPAKKHAWAMVVDLRQCHGCVPLDTPPQCTQSCINGHFVPKGMHWIEVFKQELPGGGSYFMPTPCYHCENAPCINVCPVAATYHDEDGVVLIDHHRCIGCRMCLAACPYHRRFFNWGQPTVPPEAALAEYSPEYPVPAIKGTTIKCMFCAHVLRDGRVPFCVRGCPTKTLYMGDFNEDIATNGREVVVLSRFLKENNAYRFREELGTQPRVWYIPGHGEAVGRQAGDKRELLPSVWGWGGEGFDIRPGVWPWGDPNLNPTTVNPASGNSTTEAPHK